MADKYKVGYVPGVFDLFHTGHLNLLKRSKERCDHLIAGVLTDELVYYFKNRLPVIPFEERKAIVEAVRYVDEVIPVTFENTRKIDAWKQIHFDCHFSGNDHGADWAKDLEQLQEVGAAMEYFTYTKGISSTEIKQIVMHSNSVENLADDRVVICTEEEIKQILECKMMQGREEDSVLWLDWKSVICCTEKQRSEVMNQIKKFDYDKILIAISNIDVTLNVRRKLRYADIPLEKIIMWLDMC